MFDRHSIRIRSMYVSASTTHHCVLRIYCDAIAMNFSRRRFFFPPAFMGTTVTPIWSSVCSYGFLSRPLRPFRP